MIRGRTLVAFVGAFALSLPVIVAPAAHAVLPRDVVQQKVAKARAATAEFHSMAAAKKAGYAKLFDAAGLACISMPGMGAMGVHYVNGAYVGDPTERVDRPEAVIYAWINGRYRLVGLEYVVLKQDWDAKHGVDAPAPKLFGQTFGLTPEGNRYGLPTFYSLHAWVWKNNPAGMFTPWNPKIHCWNQ
jgi:hypothetical protein